MTTTPFIEAKVNEGRLLSALSLEEQVLADGVLPNSEVMARVSLVKGILSGLLEQGRWQEAVKRVYTDGSIVRGLFDGDWEGFRQGVLESARRKRDQHFGEKTIDLLLHHGESSLLYDLIMEVPLDEEKVAELLEDSQFRDNKFKISGQQRQQAYSRLGQRMLKWKDEWGKSGSKYQKAFQYFVKANDRGGIETIYQTLLEHPQHDLGLLITTAQHDREKAPEKVKEVVTTLLRMPQLLEKRWNLSDFPIRSVYELIKKYKLPVSEQDRLRVMTVLAKGCTEYTLDELKDPQLYLLWARMNAATQPSTAYKIFRKQNYNGEEVLKAVNAGLELFQKRNDNYHKLEPSEIRDEDLKAVYPTSPLEIKVLIARHLKDREELRVLSQKYRRKSEKDGSAWPQAYHLWLEGGGEPDAPYVIGLRTRLIERELKKGGSPSFYFLDRKDQQGHREAFARVIDGFPKEAYELAAKIKDETLLQQARQALVARGPEVAQGYFRRQQDPTGIQLALEALEQKYQIPKERIEQYLAGKKEQ